jgi:hypothetical protein
LRFIAFLKINSVSAAGEYRCDRQELAHNLAYRQTGPTQRTGHFEPDIDLFNFETFSKRQGIIKLNGNILLLFEILAF